MKFLQPNEIFENHEDNFIEKLDSNLIFPDFPIKKRTAGDFSRFIFRKEDPFIKVFKRPFSLKKEEKKEVILENKLLPESTKIENISNFTENNQTVIEQKFENQTEINNELKQNFDLQQLIVNQLETSNSYTIEQIQELENNLIVNNYEKNEYNYKNIQNIENKIIKIKEETKKEFSKIDKTVKDIEGFLFK